jgi:uncharacterized lipoprotein YddW (UPF0748 family)
VEILKKIQLFFSFFFCSTIFLTAAEKFPSPQREMRAVWVATVANIDWPSKPGLSVDDQKKEVIVILDHIKELRMNAVVFQVRPQADAFYPSELEPWSFYLTGKQGKAPEPLYDPLAFWIEEAHRRGLEFHAWFNPFRAGHPAMGSEYAPQSFVRAHPECVRRLEDTLYYWMDPAMQKVQDHSYSVIMDVVKRYDIDAVHFDDYFYPYREYNKGKDFPDGESYKIYKLKGGKKSKDDWRRAAVNKFIQRVSKGIKQQKPWVKFGISPFGLFRPGFPEGIGGSFDPYEILYADTKLWLNNGWVDYFAPQLYWPISRIGMSFPILLGWWESENTKHRHLWPGVLISGGKNPSEVQLETVNQIMVARGMLPRAPGTILFSVKALLSPNNNLSKSLTDGPYTKEALIPAYPWLSKKSLKPPALKSDTESGELKLSWKPVKKEKPFLYVLYSKMDTVWKYEILPGMDSCAVKKIDSSAISAVAISSIDRFGNESKKNMVEIKKYSHHGP